MDTRNKVKILKLFKDQYLRAVILILFIAEAASFYFHKNASEEDVLKPYYILIMLAFLAIAMVAILLLMFRSKKNEQPSVSEIQTESDESGEYEISNKEAKNRIDKIAKNVAEAFTVDSEVFQRAILLNLAEWENYSEPWSRRELDTDKGTYDSILLDLYKSARQEIFSTTITEYTKHWSKTLLNEILSASSASNARSVIRVFVFAKKDEIDVSAVELMSKFDEAPNVEVRVYIDDEDSSFYFPAPIGRDFVIIDSGRVIGITSDLGMKSLLAKWHFDDDKKTEIFNSIKDRLHRSSYELRQLLNDRWDGKKLLVRSIT